MIKLFKNTLTRILENASLEPSLIEFQTFTLNAARIVNYRPHTRRRHKPNDLTPFIPSFILGQKLAPNPNSGDLRRDFIYNVTLTHRF